MHAESGGINERRAGKVHRRHRQRRRRAPGQSHSYAENRLHHYGPFSRDIDSAVLDAEEFNLITERIARRQSDGAPYSVFELKGDQEPRDHDSLLNDKLRACIKEWSDVPATVLELAATAHWLVEYEKVGSWKEEIVRRKGSKTQDGRLEKAQTLLAAARLPPGAAVA